MLILPVQVDRLVNMCGFRTMDFETNKEVIFTPKFDCVYVDNDAKQYPAHKQHVNPKTPGLRCWVDKDFVVRLFLAVNGDNRPIGRFSVSYDPAGRQYQEKINRAQWAQSMETHGHLLTEYKCMTLNPQGAAMNPQDADPELDAEPVDHPFQRALKVPVCDLIVDFGEPKTGPRLNSVSNVRHASYAQKSFGGARLQYFFDQEFTLSEVGGISPLQAATIMQGAPSQAELDAQARLAEADKRIADAEARAKAAEAEAAEVAKKFEEQARLQAEQEKGHKGGKK